jgi:hypothetical protein
MLIKSLIIGCISLSTVVGTAFATGSHDKKDYKDFKPCKLEVTDSPQIHNKHCKPKSTPIVTPTPDVAPEITTIPTPAATPEATPTTNTDTNVGIKTRSAAPAVLPSVGADGR